MLPDLWQFNFSGLIILSSYYPRILWGLKSSPKPILKCFNDFNSHFCFWYWKDDFLNLIFNFLFKQTIQKLKLNIKIVKCSCQIGLVKGSDKSNVSIIVNKYVLFRTTVQPIISFIYHVSTLSSDSYKIFFYIFKMHDVFCS